MPKPEMGNDGPTRRTVVGASAIAPLLGHALPGENGTVAQCMEWIALDREIDRLALRWSKLEAQMVREHGWFALTLAERQALPEATEMFAIDDRLEALARQRERRLKPLAHLPAETVNAVASKLVIAARLLQHEENPAQPFVASVVQELASMRCSSCGAAYTAADVSKSRYYQRTGLRLDPK
jgi:hypothetical protein